MLGHFYMKDENGNWIPIFKANNADISISTNNDEAKCWSTEIMKSMSMEVSAEFTLTEESEAALWAVSEGGIEIIER